MKHPQLEWTAPRVCAVPDDDYGRHNALVDGSVAAADVVLPPTVLGRRERLAPARAAAGATFL